MLERLKSNIRFSLSLRIAMRYALFLLSATFSAAFLFTLVYTATILPAYIDDAKTIMTAYDATGTAGSGGSGLIWARISESDGRIVYNSIANVTDENFRLLKIADGTLWVRAGTVTNEGTEFIFIANIRPYQQQYFILLITIAALDLLRVISILISRRRLAESVLRPIDEMAKAARSLSASNLDMRINILGTKNELRDLASVINDMLDRIESAYESQKAFVSDASHELRTPIAVIQGYARLLERWGMSDPKVAEEAVAAISAEAESMHELVDKLLFLARHDKKTFRLEPEIFDLAELSRELVRDANLIDKGKHIIEEGLIQSAVVNADRSAIKQALRVFLDNAIKYTPEGGSITISCEDLGGEARVSVTDTGPGMTREEAVRAFDRFYRSESVRNSHVPGHGLGLSIARLIASSHGGKIAVKTAPGEGSAFRIVLSK